MSGNVLERKGYPIKYRLTCTVDTKKVQVVFQGPGDGDRDESWFYTPDRVWIERRDGIVVASRDNPFDAFADHTADTPWDDLHLGFFLGMLSIIP